MKKQRSIRFVGGLNGSVNSAEVDVEGEPQRRSNIRHDVYDANTDEEVGYREPRAGATFPVYLFLMHVPGL